MSEIEIPDLPIDASLTINGLVKNFEEIGLYLEANLPDLQDFRFCLDAAWAPELRELVVPSIKLTVYTHTEWCQMSLKTARKLEPKEVLVWFHQGKEPRFGDRGRSKGKFVEAKANPTVSLSLEDLES